MSIARAFLRGGKGSFLTLVFLSLGIAFSACERKAVPALPPPPPKPVVEQARPVINPLPDPPLPPPLTIPASRVGDEVKADPATLAQRFRSAAESEDRSVIVGELWALDTPAAVETIRQLFLSEKEQDVKVDMVTGLTESESPRTRESRLALIASALAPNQPKDVREVAAQVLVEIEDPRVINLLQQYSQDPDPEIREAMRDALETRKEAGRQ